MKEIKCRKGDQTLVFRAETTNELMKIIYAAGEGPNATLTVVEAIMLTDRVCAEADEADPNDFSWTKDITPGEPTKMVNLIPETACDECGADIPDHAGGGLANKHHKPGCSLYDPDED